jgi:phosphoenolpyruvate carboxylase
MKEHGIRGTRNGRDPNNPGRYKHYAIRIESAVRDVYPLEGQKYKNTESVTFDSRAVEEIISPMTTPSSYTHKIHEGLVSI